MRGDDLLIATAKGEGTGPNAGPNVITTEKRHPTHPYIAELLRGSVARLNLTKLEGSLGELTREVEENNLVGEDPGKIIFPSGANPIRHVIYVIRENRTYDQILGDLKVGNGDASLTMYGSDITPNAHKLALQFGVLDNFYDSGEVSGDGHIWSTTRRPGRLRIAAMNVRMILAARSPENMLWTMARPTWMIRKPVFCGAICRATG